MNRDLEPKGNTQPKTMLGKACRLAPVVRQPPTDLWIGRDVRLAVIQPLEQREELVIVSKGRRQLSCVELGIHSLKLIEEPA